MSDRPKKNRIITTIVAFAIILFEVLPQNQWLSEEPGFKLKYISYLLQTLYCATIYIVAAKGFNYLRVKVPEQSSDFRNIMLALIIIVIFFVMMLMRAFLPSDHLLLPIIQIGTWGLLIISTILLFTGFIMPSLLKQKTMQPNQNSNVKERENVENAKVSSETNKLEEK